MKKIGGLKFGGKIFKAFFWIYLILLLTYSLFLGFEIWETGFDTSFPGGDRVFVTTLSMVFVAIYFLFYWNHLKYFIAWDKNRLRVVSKNIKKEFHRNTIKHIDLTLNRLNLEFKDGTAEELDVYFLYLSYEEINRFRKDFDIEVN